MYGTGEKAAWDRIKELRGDIVRVSGVPFEDEAFRFRSLGMDFYIRPADEAIGAAGPEGSALLSRFSYFFNHLALWWLVYAKGALTAGRLVRPEDLPGGDAFFRGTHTLPLDGVARRYGRDKEGFAKKAQALGGKTGSPPGPSNADCQVLLEPAPGFPVHVLLWLEDEEFSARADILLPSSAGVVLPLDIIWCAAMLCLLAMF